ncbi:Fe(3+) ions import ATP-binding protein FbpC [Slackia heliotrinireducens]|uniref:ABC-type sulfate/molybdate transport systems, ATPase component n=1 Tax=Slackia heliotrinireducens (strain ATCC 29202 / DSM 20476 / NCTC 11029 / RHS 1) TaxID=471855 RepID=C7N1E1_SLAHD|nr:ATP-binding cassette domain-containing protein [Slackia heliotrinireducens]ACV21233.1 ABC-type sulfate/molybdate transport systems, ATPase component [Slackia heliotrinireducens DSM 20476]VEG98667.1 Fe(3+) ions import ATP-binding protein FbpC [Slackia heliotrinireducens]
MSLHIDIKKKLAQFTLEVAFDAEAETIGFLGASGCGKSMTLRCIAGVETPDEGVIVVNGKTYYDSSARINLSAQKRKTALLFQNFQLFPNLTVEKNIAAGIDRSVSAADRKAMIEQQLERFSLEGMGKRYPFNLSGGQQQRVALARMLAAQPDILMLDEPFSALDSHLKSELEQNLLGLFESYEGTILYVSHDIDEAFRFCDRIAVVEDGHINELSPKQDIVDRPQSLATIKLSGCKNTTQAQKVDDHMVHLPVWGIDVMCDSVVPDDVKYFGVRAFMLQRVDGPGPNTYRVRADRVSDSRFERTVMVTFLDGCGANVSLEEASREETGQFSRTHMQWKVDKLAMDGNSIPDRGDEFYIRIPTEKTYVTTR